MKKPWRLIVLLVIAASLVGCQGRVFLNLDVPIIIEPAPPQYRSEVWGYLSYDHRNHHIRYTVGRNNDRHYEPLRDAKVTVVGTGLSVYTDRDGYFFLRGVPHGRITLLVQHRWVGPSSGVYISTSSR
jgi:acyl-coenzyme A synthetase/AMP-(fatty) acid ligase